MLSRILLGCARAAGFLFAGGVCVSYPKRRRLCCALRSRMGEISGCYLGNLESAGLRARRNGRSPSQCEYYFFVTVALGEGAGVAATRTTVPVVSESDGLTITLSDSVTPLRISD
jgi:hypothetical protein